MAARKTTIYKENEITILRHSLKILQFHGFWPKTGEESSGIGYTIKVLAVLVCYFFLIITAILHIVYVKTNKLEVSLIEDFVVLVSVLTVYVVIFDFYLNQKQYAHLLLQLCDYKFGRPEDLDRTENMLSLVSKVFHLFICFGFIAYGLIPIVEQSRCEEYFTKKNIEELCGNFIPTPPSLVPKIAVVPAVMNSLLVFQMNIHFAVHMKHLKSKISSLSTTGDVKKELYDVVRYHQHIIKLMDSMNDCCSRILCVHTFLTSSILGGILHQITNLTWETPVGPVYHLIVWMVTLFLNSLGGEIIINESTDIGTALYFSDWLEFDQSIKKDILFIIVRSQKSLELKALPLGYMSLRGFISVLNGLLSLTITLMSG